MKRIFLPCLCALIVVGGSAAPLLAQIDWDADNVGFYFDEAATLTAIETGMAESAHAYLVVTNITQPGMITGWQVFPTGICTIDSGFPFPADWESLFFEVIPRGGSGSPFDGSSPGWWGLDVILDAPMMITDTAVLADLYVPLVTDEPLGIYQEGGAWIEYDSGETLYLGMSTYPISTMLPQLWLSATMNSDHVPVDAEQTSFGSVKSLYR